MGGFPINRKLHILQVTGDPVGGIRKHVHSILSGLDPAVFQQSYAWSQRSGDARFQEEVAKLSTALQFTLPLPIRKKPHPSDLANILRLAHYVRRYQVDIVHGHGAKGGVYARVLRLLCRVKAIYTPHGGSVHPMFSKWETRLYGAIESALLPLTDYFVFESCYTASAYTRLVGQSPAHQRVNYNGIPAIALPELNLRTSALAYPADASIRIGVFGMLRAIKGQRFAIDALRLLKERGCRASLHLFGDGPDRQALQQLCVEYGVAHQVTFHGDVADVLPHMNAMDIVLVPSLHESFGYVAVEALSVGKYIICSRAGGLAEVVGDVAVGALVEPGSGASIADAVMDWSDMVKQEKLQVVLPDAWRKFSLEVMLANLVQVYQAVARGGQADGSHGK